MYMTPVSLLERLGAGDKTPEEWQKIHDIYTPFLRAILAKAGLPPADIDDAVQDVMLVLVRELPGFRRLRAGSFRLWLRRVAINRLGTIWRDRKRHAGDPVDLLLASLSDPDSELSKKWDEDHERYVFKKLLDLVRRDYEESTWQAFQHFAIEGKSAVEAAELTGLTANAVMLAKHRILKRLRAEAGDLLD